MVVVTTILATSYWMQRISLHRSTTDFFHPNMAAVLIRLVWLSRYSNHPFTLRPFKVRTCNGPQVLMFDIFEFWFLFWFVILVMGFSFYYSLCGVTLCLMCCFMFISAVSYLSFSSCFTLKVAFLSCTFTSSLFDNYLITCWLHLCLLSLLWLVPWACVVLSLPLSPLSRSLMYFLQFSITPWQDGLNILILVFWSSNWWANHSVSWWELVHLFFLISSFSDLFLLSLHHTHLSMRCLYWISCQTSTPDPITYTLSCLMLPVGCHQLPVLSVWLSTSVAFTFTWSVFFLTCSVYP